MDCFVLFLSLLLVFVDVWIGVDCILACVIFSIALIRFFRRWFFFVFCVRLRRFSLRVSSSAAAEVYKRQAFSFGCFFFFFEMESCFVTQAGVQLSLIPISEPTRRRESRMPSSSWKKKKKTSSHRVIDHSQKQTQNTLPRNNYNRRRTKYLNKKCKITTSRINTKH